MKLSRKLFYILILISACGGFTRGQLAAPANSQLILANSLLKNGRFDEAITLLDKAIESDKKNVGAYYLRGLAKMLSLRLRQAIPDFDKVIELAPNAAGIEQVYNNRGQLHYLSGNQEKALADFNKSISINPKYAAAYTGRGNVLSNKGELEKALADYDKAVELDSKSVAGYVGLASVYFEKGDLDNTLIALEKALELDPNSPGSWLRRGIALGLKGFWALGVNNIEKAIKGNAESSSIYYGNINVTLGELDKYITTNSKNAKAYAVRGFVKLSQNKESEAVEDFKKAFALDDKLKTELGDLIDPIKDKLND